MEFNRKNAIIGFLKEHEDQKFTPYKIAEWLVENYPEEARRKAAASRNKRIIAARTQEEKIKEVIKAYAGEISRGRFNEWKSKPNIRIESEPQVRLYYSQNPDYQINNEQVTNLKNKVSKENNITEEEAYEVLELYLDELGIYNMQIKHNFSSNKQGAGSNVRESFFQALSNSSWAHYGYLVAPILDEIRSDTRHELEMLCIRHGIGFILINMEFPEDSEILIPAREKSEIDWNMANRLAEENKDFENYLNKVDMFCKKPTKEVVESIARP